MLICISGKQVDLDGDNKVNIPFYAVSQALLGCNRMPFGLLNSPAALQRLVVRCVVINLRD